MRPITNLYVLMIIGERIREILDEREKSASWLAGMIPCERSNVYDIFRRRSISIDLLSQISTILNYNFFNDLAEEWEKGQRLEQA